MSKARTLVLLFLALNAIGYMVFVYLGPYGVSFSGTEMRISNDPVPVPVLLTNYTVHVDVSQTTSNRKSTSDTDDSENQINQQKDVNTKRLVTRTKITEQVASGKSPVEVEAVTPQRENKLKFIRDNKNKRIANKPVPIPVKYAKLPTARDHKRIIKPVTTPNSFLNNSSKNTLAYTFQNQSLIMEWRRDVLLSLHHHTEDRDGLVHLYVPLYNGSMNAQRGKPSGLKLPNSKRGMSPILKVPGSGSGSGSGSNLTTKGGALEKLVALEASGTRLPYMYFKEKDLQFMPPIKFHDAYRNPCWHEVGGKSVYVRCLPYFFVAGFTKCGTSELFDILKLHPHISPANLKEPFWFGSQFTRKEGADIYADYFSQATFDIVSSVKFFSNKNTWTHPIVTFEATPDLVYRRRTAGQSAPTVLQLHDMRALLPNAKIIITMRNPTDRAFSSYMHFNGKSLDDFHRGSVNAINEFNACARVQGVRTCAYRTVNSFDQKRVRSGLYHIFMKDLLDIFPRDQILYFRLEDYKKNKLLWLRRIFQFLGLEAVNKSTETRLMMHKVPNARSYRFGLMKNETRRLWDDFYEGHNRKLAYLLHDEAYLWKL